jgi:hypothetical protein
MAAALDGCLEDLVDAQQDVRVGTNRNAVLFSFLFHTHHIAVADDDPGLIAQCQRDAAFGDMGGTSREPGRHPPTDRLRVR